MNLNTGVMAGLALLAAGTSAQAALLGRAPLTSGGTDYQAYYDTELDVTWVADANLAQTLGFKNDGTMSWQDAQSWIASLNTANYLGTNDWRLPTVVDTGAPGCDMAYGGTDCGFNVQTKSGATVYSEMAHLYYVTLGNLGFYDTAGAMQPGWGPASSSPFSNIQDRGYWSGTLYAPDSDQAWRFLFSNGLQNSHYTDNDNAVWAVRDGEISAVPVPAAGWLFGTALVGMGLARRKVSARQALSQ